MPGLDHHRKYYSTYVQLSRLQSSKGLPLLQKLNMKDLQFAPDPRLLTEMQRLQELEKKQLRPGKEIDGKKATKHPNQMRQ
jgi:hypothetical protein